jgi:DNA polymerase III alpha subunit
MRIDKYSQQIYSENDICDLYMVDPDRNLTEIIIDKPIKLSDIIDTSTLPKFIVHTPATISVTEFDRSSQSKWMIPESYKDFDIAKYVLELCQTDEELQRVGQELLMFQERDMFPLLIYLKYLVDTMRENNVVWGVGRGSSVSSFVLFLIGIHRINSLYYDLSIDEFLK